MTSADTRISLADLTTAGVRLRPAEAVAIVCELGGFVGSGALPGVPSAHVIRFASTGDITVEGPIAADGPEVARLAYLLESLMAAADTVRAPGALRLVVARALGTIDLPAYASLDAFVAALSRFAERDAREVVREVYATWRAAAGPDSAGRRVQDAGDAPPCREPLTISDIRRARRSTRLTLDEVSQRSHIPAWLLRELEWGYFRNWPAGLYGRTQLVRYARAARLDEDLVVRTVWPSLEEAARLRGAVVVAPRDLDPADPQHVIATTASSAPTAMTVMAAAPMLVPLRVRPLVARALPVIQQYRRAVALLVIPALLLAALLPGIWQRAGRPDVGPETAPPIAQPVGPVRAANPAAAPPAAAAASAVRSSVGTAMFYSADDGSAGDAVRADSETAGPFLRVTRIVDDNAEYANVRPSPDRTRIAFDSDRDGTRAVYVAEADGRNVHRVSGNGWAAMPTWSPDGAALAFVRDEPGKADVRNLWMVTFADEQAHRLTAHQNGRTAGASWFPDGRRIAYAHGARLIVLDTRSGRERTFASPVRGRRVSAPAVGPDGRRVIFQVSGAGAWILDVAQGSVRRVLTDPTADAYTWAPDGRRVAYHSREKNNWGILLVAPLN